MISVDAALTDKARERLADRLQGLKRQNLRIQAALVHTVETGEKIPETPERLLVGKNPGALFSGMIGWRSDIQTPTKSTIHFAGGKTEEREILTNASAQNFIICDSQTNPDNYEERQRIEDDFWAIADELGKQVWGSLPKLRNHELWEMWQTLKPRSNDDMKGVWVDFVFEVAWSSNNSPLAAKKFVYLNGVTIELNSIGKIPASFGGFTLADGSTPFADPDSIPQPVPRWHSKIKDIVAASQYALDFFNSVCAEAGANEVPVEQSSVKYSQSTSGIKTNEEQATPFRPRPKGKRSRHRIDSRRATDTDRAIHAWQLEVVRLAGKGGAQSAWHRHKQQLSGIGLDFSDFKTIYNRHRKKVFGSNPKMD